MYEIIDAEFSEQYDGRFLREYMVNCLGTNALRDIEKSLVCANTTGNLWNAYDSYERGLKDIMNWIMEKT